MGSKSKRRHAQKQYNRAQNKPVVAAPAEVSTDETSTTATTTMVMTPKELRRAEKERQKAAKRLAKEQAKQAKANGNKEKAKKEKKPFFLIRFFRWLGRVFGEMGSELKKVHWPTFKQTMKATGIVLGIVVLFGLLLLGIWALLGWLHGLLVLA